MLGVKVESLQGLNAMYLTNTDIGLAETRMAQRDTGAHKSLIATYRTHRRGWLCLIWPLPSYYYPFQDATQIFHDSPTLPEVPPLYGHLVALSARHA